MVWSGQAAMMARHGFAVSAVILTAFWTPTSEASPNMGADAPASVPPAPVETPIVQNQWSMATVGQLVEAIEGAGAEGLRPSDYYLAALRRVAQNGESPALDAIANRAALSLAHDYYFGRVSDRDDFGWMIRRPAEEEEQLPARLQQAVAAGDLSRFYASLLPTDTRYAALRDALSTEQDPAARDKLRANMERWRWMPRALGNHYLYVNVPSYRLNVMEDGVSVADYVVVVGANKTRTPMLASPTSSLVVNPAWNVPQSIIKSSNLRPGKPGYIFKASAHGYTVQQPPGPRNALGRIKFNLVNDQAIYLHDTPAKAAFTRDERALSHGCIRVKDIDQLAAQLMSDGDGDASRLDEALESDDTKTVRLPKTWQVYTVYFTVDSTEPRNLVSYDDPYGYDAQLLARLDGRPLEVASRTQIAAR